MSVRDFNESNIATFRLVSGGAAYNLVLPFEADCIEWWNTTKFATDTNNISGIWFPDMPTEVVGGLVTARGTTALTTVTPVTTGNGITVLPDGSGFADNHRIPTAIDSVTGIVTLNNHGLTNGQFVRATNFRATPVADATGMYELNNKQWQVGNVTANTFQLFYPQTNMTIPFDPAGQVAFVANGVAQFTLIGPELFTQNPEPVFQYTLGAYIMGADGDVIRIRATKANTATNLGDVGA